MSYDKPNYDADACETLANINYQLDHVERCLRNLPTMRDQFAIAALHGIVSRGNEYTDYKTASRAYEIADAMLAAREVK